jgi:hypothetical protein
MYDRSMLQSLQFALEEATAEELSTLKPLLEYPDSERLTTWILAINTREDGSTRKSAARYSPVQASISTESRDLENDNTEVESERIRMLEKIHRLIKKQEVVANAD